MASRTLKNKIRPVPFISRNSELKAAVKEKMFLAVVPGNNLSVLLETVFTAHLLKKKNRGFRCEIIAGKNSETLIRTSEVFDMVHIIPDGENIKTVLDKFKPHILYIPDVDMKMKLMSIFGPGKFRIGGGRHRLFSWLRNRYRSGEHEDLLKLKSRGIDLIPESSQIRFDFEDHSDFTRRYGNLPDDFIWLSLFDEHDLTSSWPIGHAARLVRLLERSGWKTVVPVPANAPVHLVLQLKETVPEAIILDNPDISLRGMGMALSELVIGPAGAETLLASFLGKKIIELHDMRSRRILNEESFKNKDDTRKRNVASFYTRTANSLRRNLMPPMQTCNEDCVSCAHNSCMEFISPERVFEAAKRAILPL